VSGGEPPGDGDRPRGGPPLPTGDRPAGDAAGRDLVDEPVIDIDALATVDRRADLALAVCLTALGLAVVWFARDIRQGAIPDPIGAGGFAQVLGAFMAVVGAILVVRRLASWRRSPDGRVSADGGSGDEPGLPVSAVRPFVMLAVGGAWAWMIPRLGFVVATWLACGIALFAMQTRSVPKLLVAPVCFSLLTWVLFTRVSGLRFPAGPVDLFLAEIIPRLG
jgi:hypothetical protein